MRQIYEDFLDIKGAEGISAEDVTNRLDASSEEDVAKDLSSQKPSDWYKKVLNGYNCILCAEFASSLDVYNDLRVISQIKKLIGRLTAKYKKSDYNISSSKIDTHYQILSKIQLEGDTQGTLTWTAISNPIYMKVALNFTGRPEAFLDLYDKLYKIQKNYETKYPKLLLNFQFFAKEPLAIHGWAYRGFNGMILTKIADYATSAVRWLKDDPTYAERSINLLGGLLYGMMLWDVETVVKFQELAKRWAEKRSSYVLNEDFIDAVTKDDMDAEALIAETAPENIFTHNPFDSFIIVTLTKDNGEYKGIRNARALKIRLQQSLRAMLGSKFDIELIAMNIRTAQQLECRMLTEDENKMYINSRHKNARALIVIRFNLPLTFGKYCDMVAVIDNLKRATLGGFQDPTSVQIGYAMKSPLSFGQLMIMNLDTWRLRQMHDISLDMQLEKYEGDEIDTYRIMFQNASKKPWVIEDILEEQKKYLLKRLETNNKGNR